MLNTLKKIHYTLYTTILAVSMFAIVKLLYSINLHLHDLSMGQNYAIEMMDLFTQIGH